ncbi:MAG: ScyD/ScyE family protein [Isosphaeraceae bacterium]|nr:ScyD/ScyE family protein [Isosphaeraceae bacterium]
MRTSLITVGHIVATAGLALTASSAIAQHRPPSVSVLATGLEGGSGSTIGPDGALYVTEWEVGRVSRVDPKTGEIRTFAEGLPAGLPEIPYSGACDVAFIGKTAYVLVTLVAEDVGGNEVVGIYRIDGPNRSTVIADLGSWSMAHPPSSSFEVPTGAQFALQPYRGGLLLTDSHHNRVLWVSTSGEIREVATYDNVAPAGIAARGRLVFVAEAGPIPHLPEDGRVSAFVPNSAPRVVATGTRLPVDVEFGPENGLFAIAQGEWDGVFPGDPALPNAGSLLRVESDGSFTTIVDGLDRPTSLEFIGRTAYVVTFSGEILKIR